MPIRSSSRSLAPSIRRVYGAGGGGGPAVELPTSGLTGNFDASIAGDRYSTFVNGGPHTGVPGDGDPVAVWRDARGAALIAKQSGANGVPVLRSAAPGLPRPCLDFSGGQRLELTDHSGVAKTTGDFLTPSAWSVIVAFRAESVAHPGSVFYEGEPIIAHTDGYWGVYLSNSGGVPKVVAYNWGPGATYGIQPITVGGNHVFAARLSGGVLYSSLDGGAEAATASANTGSMGGVVRLGAGAYGGGVADVRVGEIALYNVALTGDDLADAIAYFVSKWAA